MKTWIAAALAAGVLAFAGQSTINPAAAASPKASASKDPASSDIGARRASRRYGYRSYEQPHYYGRPDYYRPYPYSVPVPFFLGFAFSPFGL